MPPSTAREFTAEETIRRDAVLRRVPPRPRVAPEHLELIKRTRSMCPECWTVIDADVVASDGQVRMHKVCPEHGAFEALVEIDEDFYRATMNEPPVVRVVPHTLVIPITHACNLNCALCYVPKRDRDDLSIEQIGRIIDDFPGKVVALSGGEPTLRKDLMDIIRLVRSKGKQCRLLTNAIKLADGAFVREMVDAGLQHVLFSFNGFSNRVYEVSNRAPLLDIKMKAIENCVDNRLEMALSPTVFRDLNEDQIGPIMDLCLEHAPYISQIRIRGAARVGRYGKIAPLSTYELLKLAAEAMGRTPADFISELERDKVYHSTSQFNMLAVFDAGRQGTPYYSWCSGEWYLDDNDYGKAKYDLQRKISKDVGQYTPFSFVEHRIRTLQINTWGWPEVANIDFQEIWGHGIVHLYDNRVPMNFFEAVLRAEGL